MFHWLRSVHGTLRTFPELRSVETKGGAGEENALCTCSVTSLSHDSFLTLYLLAATAMQSKSHSMHIGFSFKPCAKHYPITTDGAILLCTTGRPVQGPLNTAELAPEEMCLSRWDGLSVLLHRVRRPWPWNGWNGHPPPPPPPPRSVSPPRRGTCAAPASPPRAPPRPLPSRPFLSFRRGLALGEEARAGRQR